MKERAARGGRRERSGRAQVGSGLDDGREEGEGQNTRERREKGDVKLNSPTNPTAVDPSTPSWLTSHSLPSLSTFAHPHAPSFPLSEGFRSPPPSSIWTSSTKKPSCVQRSAGGKTSDKGLLARCVGMKRMREGAGRVVADIGGTSLRLGARAEGDGGVSLRDMRRALKKV